MDQHGQSLGWKQKLRRLVGPTVSAFLCYMFVVVWRLEKLGGHYSFLTYTAFILFFFPRGGIIYQLEVTVLSLLGCLCGLAVTCASLAIAAYCGATYGSESVQARAVLATGLAVLSLICGFFRSYSPRLNEASRIALFFPIFLLTASTGLTSMRGFYFTDVFFVSVFAAIFALVPTILFSYRPSSPRMGQAVQGCMDKICELLPLTLSLVVDDEDRHHAAAFESGDTEADRGSTKASVGRVRQDRLVQDLRHGVESLPAILDSLTLELTRARVRPALLRPFVSSLKRLHRNALLGPGIHVPGERIQAAIDKSFAPVSVPLSVPNTPRHSAFFTSTSYPFVHSPPSPEMTHRGLSASVSFPRHLRFQLGNLREGRQSRSLVAPPRPKLVDSSTHLVEAITKGLKLASSHLSLVCAWRAPLASETTPPIAPKQDDLLQAKADIEFALADLQVQLKNLLDGLGASSRVPSSIVGSPTQLSPSRPVSRMPSHVSMNLDIDHLQVDALDRDHFRIAFYMTALLDCAKDVLALLYAVIEIVTQADEREQWFWPDFSRAWLADLSKRSDGLSPHSDGPPLPTKSSEVGCDDELNPPSRHVDSMDFVTTTVEHEQRRTSGGPKSSAPVRAWRRIWDRHGTLKGRIAMSRFLHTLRHSHHILFAIKMALGVSLLALPGFLHPSSPGRAWFLKYRGAWAVISYMYVLEVHTGATLKVGFFRLLGTFIGAVTAYVFDLISRSRPWPMIVLCTAASVPLSYGILFTSHPQLPTVIAITLPPVVFLHFLGLDAGQSSIELAYTRFTAITIGIVGAILVGSLIWPIHARVRYFLSVSSTLDHLTEYYLCMSRDNLRPSLVYQGNSKQYDHLEASVRKHIERSRLLVDIQKKEVSLLPRPIKLYSEILDCLERVIEMFAEIRVLRFSVPRKATVLDVLPLRRELVSSILINLWAVSQSFRSRTPLPQYLPSPRVALEGIMETVDEHARHVRRKAEISAASEESSRGHREELAILYGMAENEAIGELCNLLDELVAAAHTLFGSRTFVETTSQPAGVPEG